MKTTPEGEARRAEMRLLAEHIVGQPIEWNQELSVLMDCAFHILAQQDQREDPMRVLEDFAGATALFTYAAAIGWISDKAADELVDFGRHARSVAMRKWAGKVVTVHRGAGRGDGVPQGVTKH
ncbi:hypothetical protein [Ralstonia sp. ASV6]|uniref:hypothetical protein n=1 Tax=Ralstonia sp. ASV6 TaxID=2795124 RepID=UPI0018ED6C6A|nr:hypothetical protein [Ralstonia sp. ASV6]